MLTELERLGELDAMYGGTVPGLLAGESDRLAMLEAMHARKGEPVAPQLAVETLPVSVVRRLRAVEALSPASVFCDDDVDGLSVLLAGKAEVSVLQAGHIRRSWIDDEAQRAGVAERLAWCASAPAVDAAVIAVGPPYLSYVALERAITAVRPGGHIFAQLRAPWEDRFMADAAAAKLEITAHYREIDVQVLPGGFAIDSASDLIVYERTDKAEAVEVLEDEAAAVRAQPYYGLDFDELNPESMKPGAIERFVDHVAAQISAPEVTRSLTHGDTRELVCWYNRAGAGFTAELAVEPRHLLVSLMPYDLHLEYAVHRAAFETLGDHFTRVRPHLTGRWRQENIVG